MGTDKRGSGFWAVWRFDVAQIGNLLYRGLAIRKASETINSCRLPVGETAGWQSALPGWRQPANCGLNMARMELNSFRCLASCHHYGFYNQPIH
jgi:hypothetical protein